MLTKIINVNDDDATLRLVPKDQGQTCWCLPRMFKITYAFLHYKTN